MPLPLMDIYLALPAFLLVLFRVSGLLLATPLFSGPMMPLQFRVLLALGISMAVFPPLMADLPREVTLASALTGLLGEVAVGMFMGLAMSLLFAGVEMAGQIVAYQAGLGLGQAFNPMFESSSTAVSQMYLLITMMIFLAVGGHRALIVTLLESFHTVPPLSFEFHEGIMLLLVDLLTVSFTIVIRVGGPTILAVMLGFLTLGFISRTVPQLNILTIGFPLKLGVALIMMALTMIGLEPVLIEGLSAGMDAIRAGFNVEPASSASVEL